MKKIFLFCFCLAAIKAMAQKQIFDLVSYTQPGGWKKEVKDNQATYTKTDKKSNTWCQVFILKSTLSKGSIEADFDSEWQELVVKNYNPVELPQTTEVQEAEGWKIKAGVGKFVFNNQDAMVMMTTASGYERCASIVAITNSETYTEEITRILESVEMIKPGRGNPVDQPILVNHANAQFEFSTTRFDDGWTSVVQEDWVEVTKNEIKVLLHYPKEGTIFPADPEVLTSAAWDILVAPRYSNLQNYKTAYIATYDRPYLGMGHATDKATGTNVFIVLFRQGQSGWIELVSPDKNSFMQQFKFDPESIQWDSNSDLMIPLQNLTGYNKFAVGASDLKGKWTSDFTGIQQLYNVYTGSYAGMNINQSNEEFIFNADNTYLWRLLAVNGMVGNARFTEVKSAGQFNVPNNWQVKFSEIESGLKTFHAFWSCIKGARILNLLDANAPGSGIYTKYGLAK